MNKKVILIIMDGWGLGTNSKVSAIDHAKTPFINSLYLKYPHSKLEASGLAVGLPAGQMGNSEVGHMNIGAGRVVYQDLVRINKTVEEHTFENEQTLVKAFEYAKLNNKKVHLMGLISDGGVHSHISHLKALCSIAAKQQVENVFIHAFTDGRDADPKGGLNYLASLQQHLLQSTGQIASIIGRYYAMDRDNRWERVKLAYDAMVYGQGQPSTNLIKSLEDCYMQGITDEFIKPIIAVDSLGKPLATIEEGDVVLCYNFRTDRGREIMMALSQKDLPEQNMKKLSLYNVTMTNYDDTFTDVKVIFDKDNLNNTLGEVISNAGKSQIRIAETEKYPHVTFFFSGGRELPFDGERRLLCSSPKVATYDLQPEMSAYEIKDKIIAELNQKEIDFVCLNFANADMVGHTGNFNAAVRACEVVDECTNEVVTLGLKNGYTSIVIADHGNADIMINEDGTPNTQHSTNLVPCILVDNNFTGGIKDGKLGDLAPTILKLMGIQKPLEMDGDALI